MKIKYRVKRMIVGVRQRSKEREWKTAHKKMNNEQLKVFNLITEFAGKYNSAIKFDNETTEVLIILPKMLITIQGGTVKIDNTTGFLSVDFPIDAYNLMICILNKEAHKDRRKLKHEVKQRIHDFLNKITE